MENSVHERVAIFIDGSNLYHALEENCRRTSLDFAKFSPRLAGDRKLIRTYYYNVLQDPQRNPEGHRDQQKFLEALASIPHLEVRLGTTKQREGVVVEKGLDIMLAIDLLQLAWNNAYDTAVLVSGDGDFTYAVQAVKNYGKNVEVAAFESNASRELLQVADQRHMLAPSFFRDLWMGQPRAQRQTEASVPAPARPVVPAAAEPGPAPAQRKRRRRRHRPAPTSTAPSPEAPPTSP